YPPSEDNTSPEPLVDPCNSPAVQALSSHWLVLLSLCFNIPTAIVAPVYGYLSDRGWRKGVMFFPVLGSLVEKLAVLSLALYSPATTVGIPSYILPTLCIGTFL
ncbi:hypothetical protein HDU93_006342, partial [Gonapodya sp. JEL0774]